jgi:anti-sigma regulatory factor (Ser/Thr protein kinase)
LDVVTPDRRQRDAATAFGAASAVIVPLLGRERIYGALTFLCSTASGRIYTPEDVPLAEEIGRRAGIAIENARLYDQQRNVAESLQHALLPQQLPSIPGFEATARYLPGSPGERVGGDWYDLFEVPSGEIAVVIGDVVGHGIPAASLMAQLRNSMRAYVWNGMAPAEVLTRLNQLLYGLEREGMATASVGLLDPITSRLRFANAGHPPFLHMRGDETNYVGEGLGPPLGAVPFARFKEETIELRSQDTAVFYTDGLVEDRVTTLDAGLERMRAAVLAGAGEINELADSIVSSCLGSRKVEDDVAVLVLRSVALGAKLDLRLPAEPRILASLRQTMRRWLYEHDVGEDVTQDVLLACGEACNNAIEHGSSPMDGWFDVEATIDGDLEFSIRSPGTWRAPRADGGGRGLPVMKALMDSVDIDRGSEGIIVRMTKKLLGSKVPA